MNPAIIISIIQGATQLVRGVMGMVNGGQVDKVSKDKILAEIVTLRKVLEDARSAELEVLKSIKPKAKPR